MNRSQVTVPAKPEWALVLRTALSGIGAVANLSLDTIDDLRTAADEAFDLLTHQSREVHHVTLECVIEENVVVVRLTGHRARHYQECTPVDPEIAQLIIGTLVTNVHMEGDKCGIYSVHMSLPKQAS